MVKIRTYDYSNDGFNPFMQRSLSSNPNAATLSHIAAAHPQQNINFDQQQVSGSMGDIFAVGSILIDGVAVRIDGRDTNGQPVWRLGTLGD